MTRPLAMLSSIPAADLWCGLCGFVLGAAAMLAGHQAPLAAAPAHAAPIDILTQAVSVPRHAAAG